MQVSGHGVKVIDTITAVGDASKETRRVVELLPGVRATTDERTGATTLSAFFDGMHVTVEADNRLRLFGSLTKLALGTNIKNANRRDVQRAVTALSDGLCFDLDEARVYRLDVGATMPMPRPVALYLAVLNSAPRYRPANYEGETVLFRSGRSKKARRTLSFYDKAQEAPKDAAAEELQDSYLLRYEVQFQRRVKEQLKQAVTLSDLHDPVFYRRLVRRWAKEYGSVRKAARPVVKPTGSTRAFKDQLAAVGLRAYGVEEARALIQAGRAEEAITRNQAYRLNRAVRELACDGASPEDAATIEEMDEAVRRVAAKAGVERGPSTGSPGKS